MATAATRDPAEPTVAFLGPAGTFSEEALRGQGDLASGTLMPLGSIGEVLSAVVDGRAEVGFVPIENAIEGTVHLTVDNLIFEVDLLVQREVVLDIHLHLMARPGTTLGDIRRVLSIPVATAQCRRFLAARLPDAELVPTNSTAEAARIVSQAGSAEPAAGDPANGGGAAGDHPTGDRAAESLTGTGADAAIAPRPAADLYGLELLASTVEDHPDNQTRFVAVTRGGVPSPTGHDKTSIVCFQRDDHPGSLHAILSEFAARDLNLTKLESRPTKRQLGRYCFLVDLEGHIADEVVADCLRVLHAELADVKFLGSYPSAGDGAPARRAEAGEAWRRAETWMAGLRHQVGCSPLQGPSPT